METYILSFIFDKPHRSELPTVTNVWLEQLINELVGVNHAIHRKADRDIFESIRSSLALELPRGEVKAEVINVMGGIEASFRPSAPDKDWEISYREIYDSGFYGEEAQCYGADKRAVLAKTGLYGVYVVEEENSNGSYSVFITSCAPWALEENGLLRCSERSYARVGDSLVWFSCTFPTRPDAETLGEVVEILASLRWLNSAR